MFGDIGVDTVGGAGCKDILRCIRDVAEQPTVHRPAPQQRMSVALSRKTVNTWGWSGGLVVKSTDFCYRGPEFDSRHPC